MRSSSSHRWSDERISPTYAPEASLCTKNAWATCLATEEPSSVTNIQTLWWFDMICFAHLQKALLGLKYLASHKKPTLWFALRSPFPYPMTQGPALSKVVQSSDIANGWLCVILVINWCFVWTSSIPHLNRKPLKFNDTTLLWADILPSFLAAQRLLREGLASYTTLLPMLQGDQLATSIVS